MPSIFRFFIFFVISISYLAVLCRSFSPENPTGRQILVLLDDLAIKSSHSLYFKSLQSRGFQLDFKLADDPKIALQRYGQYLYDALIIFAPSVERFGGSIGTAAIMDFVDSGHDLILAADESASDLIREVASECGVDFDEDPGAVVIDHTSYAVSDTNGDHSIIAADDFIESDVILGSKIIELQEKETWICRDFMAFWTCCFSEMAFWPCCFSKMLLVFFDAGGKILKDER